MDPNFSSVAHSPNSFNQSKKSIIKSQDLFEAMKNEKNRFNSLNGKWPLDFISINDLAEAGFFYLLSDDKVQCAFCKLILSKWEVGDDPLDEHKKFSSKCHFISSKFSEPQKTVVTSHFNYFYTPSLISSKPLKAKVPRMSDVKKRLSSYKGWSLTMISIEDLAICGLFYTGVNDVVTCFSCGISLRDWEPYDEPATKHSNIDPNCLFLHFVISSSYLERRKTKKPSNSTPKPQKPTVAEILKSEIACKAREIFPSQLVEEVVGKHLKETGEVFTSLQHLCNKVLEYEEKKLKIRLSTNPKENGQSTASSTSEIISKKSNIDTKTGSLLCKICLIGDLEITFQPCGHLISCNLCSQRVNQCPICRLPIQRRIKTYLS